MTTYGQHPDPTHTIAHLSDPHLLADSLQYGAIDTVEHLGLAMDRLEHLDPVPQALVFTGDLADRAEPAAYERLKAIVEPAAAKLGAQVVWTMGNHDEREAYSAALFGEASSTPQDQVYDVAGLRIVAMDSTVPGWHHGALTDEQLHWLATQLASPAEHGTVLAMHHPPIPIPTIPPAALIELDDQHKLAEVVRGSDVRLVIGGHFHYTSWGMFAGVPVSVAAATCYTMDPAPVDRLISGVDGDQAFTLLHVYADQIVHTVVPTHRSPEVTGHPRSMQTLLESLTPEQMRDQISRKDSDYNSGALEGL